MASIRKGLHSSAAALVSNGAAAAQSPDRPRRIRRNRRAHHKSLQLCRQVFQAVSDGLAESGDELLQALVVESVLPAPSTARLCVTVYLYDDDVDHDDIMQRLSAERWALRQEVAAAIHRRRTPELTFKVNSPPDRLDF